jgi:hypothetical protein
VDAWSVVTFDVSVAADIPGTFNDELTLLLNGQGSGRMHAVTVPVTATVTGCPLEFDETVVGLQVCVSVCVRAHACV